MSLSEQDFHRLVRALQEHPEWRAELRRLVLTEELLALPDLVRELVEAQRRTEERLAQLEQRTEERFQELAEQLAQLARRTEERFQELAETQRRTEERLAQLEQRTEERFQELAEQLAQLARRTEERFQHFEEQLAQLARRTEERFQHFEEQLAQLARRTEERFQELAEAQRRTEEALTLLTRRVDLLSDQVGDLRGAEVERRYRERAHAYFGRVLRRLRVLSSQELADIVEKALESGQISEEERLPLLWTDVVVEGRNEAGERVAMVVEVSATVSRRDVERAHQRAALFAKATGLPVWAAVAGEGLAEGVPTLAETLGVWQVVDGRVLSP